MDETVFFVDDGFESSDDELEMDREAPFVRWVATNELKGVPARLGVSSLPGSTRRHTLPRDVSALQAVGVTDVFVMCTPEEVERAGMRAALPYVERRGVRVHWHPMARDADEHAYGHMAETLWETLTREGTTVVMQDLPGCGRVGTVLALLLMRAHHVTPPSPHAHTPTKTPVGPRTPVEGAGGWDATITRVKGLVGTPFGVHTVRQYNVIMAAPSA